MFIQGLGRFLGPTQGAGCTPVAPQYGKSHVAAQSLHLPIHGSNSSQKKVTSISEPCLIIITDRLGHGQGSLLPAGMK